MFLNQQRLVTSIIKPVTQLFQSMASFLYVDDSDLSVFNSGSDDTAEVVCRSQKLINACRAALKFTNGYLKLSK